MNGSIIYLLFPSLIFVSSSLMASDILNYEQNKINKVSTSIGSFDQLSRSNSDKFSSGVKKASLFVPRKAAVFPFYSSSSGSSENNSKPIEGGTSQVGSPNSAEIQLPIGVSKSMTAVLMPENGPFSYFESKKRKAEDMTELQESGDSNNAIKYRRTEGDSSLEQTGLPEKEGSEYADMITSTQTTTTTTTATTAVDFNHPQPSSSQQSSDLVSIPRETYNILVAMNHIVKAEQYFREKKWFLANKEYLAAIRIKQNQEAHIYARSAECFFHCSDYESALNQYDLAIKIDNTAEYNLFAGDCLIKMGQYMSALDCYNNAGYRFELKGDINKAIECYKLVSSCANSHVKLLKNSLRNGQ